MLIRLTLSWWKETFGIWATFKFHSLKRRSSTHQLQVFIYYVLRKLSLKPDIDTMLTVNNHESSLTVDIESWLADSDGKELKSSSTIQASRFTDVGTLGRLFVIASVRSQRHGNVILFWFYNYTGSCWSIGRRKEIINIYRWGLITLTFHLCIVQSIAWDVIITQRHVSLI